jgi:di/tricarboxylate transporter
MYQRRSNALERRSGAVGWAIFILGVLGLVFAAFEYSIYSHNKDVLHWNERWGTDTPEQHELVDFQLTVTITAFSVGTIFAMIGLAIMSSSYVHNRELDRLELIEAVKGETTSLKPTPGTKLFCDSCGSPLGRGSRFCPTCGRQLNELD